VKNVDVQGTNDNMLHLMLKKLITFESVIAKRLGGKLISMGCNMAIMYFRVQ